MAIPIIGNIFSRVSQNANALSGQLKEGIRSMLMPITQAPANISTRVNANTKSLRNMVTDYTNRTVPLKIDSIIRPVSNNLGQVVNNFAGNKDANPKRGLSNSLGDMVSKFNYNLSTLGNSSVPAWKPTPVPGKYANSSLTSPVTGGTIGKVFSNITPTIKPSPTLVPKTNAVGVGTTIAGFVRQPTGGPFYGSIVDSSNKSGVHPALTAATLFNESGINPNTPDNKNFDTSGKLISTDRGIGQINDIAHPDITEAQARDPKFVIPWVANKIATAQKYFNGDINRALASYNVGIGGASIKGPYAAGVGPRAQYYLNKLAMNLTPETIQALGLKISSPEEHAQIVKRLSEENAKAKSKKKK